LGVIYRRAPPRFSHGCRAQYDASHHLSFLAFIDFKIGAAWGDGNLRGDSSSSLSGKCLAGWVENWQETSSRGYNHPEIRNIRYADQFFGWR
jgi:hypothetical protein